MSATVKRISPALALLILSGKTQAQSNPIERALDRLRPFRKAWKKRKKKNESAR